MSDSPGTFFDRLTDRLGDAWEDRPTAEWEVKAWLAELREDVKLTPTFLAVRMEAQSHLEAVMAEFGRTVAVFEHTAVGGSEWPPFFAGEFFPEMVRAIQDLRAAQLRDDIDRPGGPIDVFRTMRSRLEGLRGLMGDWS